MPYHLSKDGLCVEDQTGKTVPGGCHPTHKKALEHLAALQINVVDAGKEMPMKTCPECGAKVKSDAKKCPECGAAMTMMQQSGKELKASDYLVVEDNGATHLPIAKVSGTPDRGLAGAAWAALFSAGGFRGQPYSGPNKAEAQRKLKALYTRMNWPMPSEKAFLATTKELFKGLKAVEAGDAKYLVLWTTNSFLDREGEVFSQKALEDYVARRDQSGLQDRVWFWHVKGTDFATVVWQDVVGKFLVEVAQVDATEYGHKMFEAIQHPEMYSELLPEGWGTSHGYLYRSTDKRDGVYSFFEKYESTVLPYHRASNAYAGLKEAITMGAMTAEKRAALVKLLGSEEKVKELLAKPEQATALLDQLGISSKELADEPEVEGKPEAAAEPEAEVEAEAEAEPEVTAADGQAYELELDEALVKEIAAQVDVQAKVKEVMDGAKADWIKDISVAVATALMPAVKEMLDKSVGTKEQSAEQTFSQIVGGRLRLKPYSPTNDPANVLPKAALKQLTEDAGQGDKEVDVNDVVARVANAMLMGKIA